MVDQTTRLEVATVKAEQGSDILHQFANNAAGGAAIPTESGNIPALKDVILNIQQEGADKISFATTIYPSTAAGIAATTNGAIFLVRTSDPDEIYAVYQNSSGTAVDTGQRALSASAIQAAMDAALDAASDAEAAASSALAQTARFIAPRTTDPTTRDNGNPLVVGDQYLNTSTSPNQNRIYGTTGWFTPDVDGPALQIQIDAKMTSPMTTLGDLIRGGASGAPGRLAIGTTGQVLTVSGGQPAWATPSAAVTLSVVSADAGTTRTLALTDSNKFNVVSDAAAKTRTVPPQSSVTWLADTEISFFNDTITNLTIAAGSGVTLVAPAGGSLIVPPRGTVLLKRLASDRWAVIGLTVSA